MVLWLCVDQKLFNLFLFLFLLRHVNKKKIHNFFIIQIKILKVDQLAATSVKWVTGVDRIVLYHCIQKYGLQKLMILLWIMAKNNKQWWDWVKIVFKFKRFLNTSY